MIHDLSNPFSSPETSAKNSSQTISDRGKILRLPPDLILNVTRYLQPPLACTLEGQCVFIPREQYTTRPSRVCMYNPETDVWTEDSRACIDLGNSSCAHTVVGDTLHVVRERREETDHWIYTLKKGWKDIGRLPETVNGVSFAQTLGRLVLLGCDSGIHLHDTISGDWSRIGDSPVPEPYSEYPSVVGTCITDNTLLCLHTHRLVDDEDDCLMHASLVTLNETLLYPSEEMGWGRLLEWDTDWRGPLGIQ
ncbi:hypothetical protein KIPB_008098 [Kipferlia bialata]|uniref:Uncharacterized protein n=1 Tax=Kipferlia bialata TaxID=797122 RepID=A0A391P4A5_9EUKA|nr:hypothetical protein KIPB_008098 [Kipferlia bialata]|eukprot:g8098.t1